MSNDESDPFDEPQTMSWEDAASGAVDHALESAEYDEIQGAIILSDSTGDPRMAHDCYSVQELQEALEDIYDQHWYANVPFDGGQAVFEGDACGYVSRLTETEEIQAFFAQFGPQPEGEVIITAGDLLKPRASKVIRVDVADINDELIAYLAEHPEEMHDLKPRKFEELIAELFRSKGYEVQLTPQSHDGGVDIYATHRSEIGTALILIECKRYAQKQGVGVGIVRALYGVVEQKGATRGIVATTSYFTKEARKLHNDLEFRLALTDYHALCRMLNEWRIRKA